MNRVCRRLLPLAVIAAALLAGCTTPPPRETATAAWRIEAASKHELVYARVGRDRVRIASRGEFVLDHEDADTLYLRIYASPARVPAWRSDAMPDDGAAAASIRDARGSLRLHDIGHGLPHQGQWRDHFVVADLGDNGNTQLVFAKPRKSGGGPRAWQLGADGWHGVPLSMPSIGYGYGAAAVADVDGDGRNDIALAMHLAGFLVLRANAAGGHELLHEGLPRRGTERLAGSGVAVQPLPAAPGTPAPLLLLIEPMAPADAATAAPGLAEYRWHEGAFRITPIDAQVRGTALAHTPASARCAAKLAVLPARSGAVPLLQRQADGSWAKRALPVPDGSVANSAVALGDADGDGCSDLAVAYSQRGSDGWHARIDLYLDRGAHWTRVAVLDAAGAARITALGFGAPGPRSPAWLFALDGDGRLRAYGMRDGRAEWLLDATAPAWRSGCAGSDLHALPDDGHGLRLAASFAGEPVMGAFDRCRNGGGIEAWRVVDAR